MRPCVTHYLLKRQIANVNLISSGWYFICTRVQTKEKRGGCTWTWDPSKHKHCRPRYSPEETGTELCCRWRPWALQTRAHTRLDQPAVAWSWFWISSCGPPPLRTRQRRKSGTLDIVEFKGQGKHINPLTGKVTQLHVQKITKTLIWLTIPHFRWGCATLKTQRKRNPINQSVVTVLEDIFLLWLFIRSDAVALVIHLRRVLKHSKDTKTAATESNASSLNWDNRWHESSDWLI